MRRPTGIVCIALALTVAASSARAQSPTIDPLGTKGTVGAAASETTPPRLGPTLEGGIVGAHRATVTPSYVLPRPAAGGPHVGRDQALMIVGGAGIVVGAIIQGTAGTLFMVGGAIAGLYGLYEYLQ